MRLGLAGAWGCEPGNVPAEVRGGTQRPVMGSNSSGLVGQTHRKEPSTFSHSAEPHTPCSVSHSFTSTQ